MSDAPLPSGTGPLSVCCLRTSGIDERLTEAWADLERRAVEPCAYLSPHFVLPALRHLDPMLSPVILTVSRADGVLVGLGVFEERAVSRRFPLRHLAAYRSRHSFLSSLLLDRAHAREAVGALLDRICGRSTRWHGVTFEDMPAGVVQQLLLEEGRRRGNRWFEYERLERATLQMADAGDGYAERCFSSARRKRIRRNWRRLESLGCVEWELRREEVEGCVERFLQLEHLGWKGAAGDSLASTPGSQAFFREMAEGFGRDRRIFFTEIRLDGEVIASTSNLVSVDEGYAFKSGWDPRFAAMSIGMLNETELIRRAPALLPGLVRLDSGAQPGSYLEDIWVGRRVLVDGLLTTTATGRAAGRLAAAAIVLKRALFAMRAPAARTQAQE
jgi:CelD/BcsL family acetyltransferase involved in cellulose biosynthesis